MDSKWQQAESRHRGVFRIIVVGLCEISSDLWNNLATVRDVRVGDRGVHEGAGLVDSRVMTRSKKVVQAERCSCM